MAEPTNVRLVRCPNCKNLLPELANYSVYRCGGCGAVLRAKNEGEELREEQSEKSTEGRVSGTGSTSSLQNSAEKQHGDVSEDASEMDVKSNSSKCQEKEPGIVCDDGGKLVVEDGLSVELDKCGMVDEVGEEHGDLNSGIRKSARMSVRSQQTETDEADGFRRSMKSVVEEGVRFSTSKHPGEGPSSYSLPSGYSYGEPLRNRGEEVEANRAQYLEKDRAELLRKLDELKEQLSRSCEVGEKPKEKVPLGGRMIHPDPYGGSSDAWFPGGSSAADKHATRSSSYVSHHPEPFPYNRGRDMSMHTFDPSINGSRHLPAYEYPYGSQMMKRPPQQFPGHYAHGSRQYFSGHYFDGNPDVFEPYQPNAPLDLPPCSCLHCYEKHQGILPPVPPTHRYHDISKDSMFYHQENPHNSRATAASFNSRGLQSHARWPSDLASGMGGFVRSRPHRAGLASGDRCRRPVAGGAPFFTCSNCSELLQLPKRILAMTKNQPKIRCGSCSTVIDLAFVNQKLVLSARTDRKQPPSLADDSSTEFVKHNGSYSHHRMNNHANVDFSSDDYDTSGFDFQTVDADLHPTASLKPSRPEEMRSLPSSSPTSSECEGSLDLSNGPIKSTLATSLANSPLHQQFDYSSTNHAVNRLGKGNRSSRSDQEKVTTRTTTRQNSLKEASLASEMDVSFNDYGNGENFHDPGDDAGREREDNQLKTGKGNESFLANIIKKSFKDFTKSNHGDYRGKNSVFVNGHPVPDRVVRKAEKVAGQIHPGQYWYDYRAGFWGVMGGPGVGILPPFIEELNYPIPENCAGGNTGVYVNGRELHQQDLDLLSTRGLPTERDRSYIIEISGRVLDEDTGEELDSLGKLAPTIERVKRGFGMKVPKAGA
ncbi:Protein ENHANCED DISEASE RESISTANCE 4 [Linum grandiflorum]